MAKAEASVEELVSMIERGELRLPEMQRQYVWRSTRVWDLLDSLYRGYPSGAILLWETDEDVPQQKFAIGQSTNPYQSTRLLLDGQQRLTSLSAVIRGEPLTVRGRRKPIDLLFNLEHPERLAFVTEVNEDGDDDDDGRLDITAEELEGKNRRSALFKTMFLAFRSNGATDWRSNLAISIDHSGSHHRLQFHHIFPKAQLKKHYTTPETDDIANLAFIGGNASAHTPVCRTSDEIVRVWRAIDHSRMAAKNKLFLKLCLMYG